MKYTLGLFFRIKISFLFLAILVSLFPDFFQAFKQDTAKGEETGLQAESLWRDKDPYSYPRVVSPGTVVKVVLKSTLKVEYDSEYKATFDHDIKTVPDKKLVSDLPTFTTNSTFMRSKVGKSKTNGKILGTMAVLVTGIDPGSGNLELEGSKTYSYGEEKINLRLSGTISPGDLDKNRNISSDNVANLRVEFQGTLSPKELTDPNIQMKTITNPDGTVTRRAELSETEKQELILKNIKRVLGESN
jgi:flagellar L-ring protein precursor FlgH